MPMSTLARSTLGAVFSLAAASSGLEDTAVLVQSHAGAHSSMEASAGVGLLQGRSAMLRNMATELQGQFPQLQQLFSQNGQKADWKKLMEKAQEGMKAAQESAKAAQEAAKRDAEKKIGYNCTAHPWMCEAPFNCHLETEGSQERLNERVATPDGHANVASWCGETGVKYTPNLVQMCLRDHDLKSSGLTVYTEAIRGRFGPTTAETDASYCFIEGHCSNTAVTYNTTLEEAEKMCDFRYGHEAWTSFGLKDFMKPDVLHAVMGGGADALHGGFFHTALTRPFLLAACAMGNYHCDVTYCRDTYCKEPYYIKKYGHMLPKIPGHLIQQLTYLE